MSCVSSTSTRSPCSPSTNTELIISVNCLFREGRGGDSSELPGRLLCSLGWAPLELQLLAYEVTGSRMHLLLPLASVATLTLVLGLGSLCSGGFEPSLCLTDARSPWLLPCCILRSRENAPCSTLGHTCHSRTEVA